MQEGTGQYYNVELADFKVSESDKSKPEYLMAMTDQLIESLVNEASPRRRQMLKMRAMRMGIRDPQEYAYLSDNYGLGNPTELRFTPVVKNRIDALTGILSSADFDWQVTVNDIDSISASEVMKSGEVLSKFYQRMEESIGETQPTESINKLIANIEEEINKNWKNVFEDAANNLVKMYRDDIDIDLKEKRKELLEDIAVVGECYYRPVLNRYGELADVDILLPENYYTEMRRDQRLAKECSRGVYVRYLTLEEVLTKYGHLLTADQKEDILSNPVAFNYVDAKTMYELENFYRMERRGNGTHPDEVNYGHNRYIKVYETEWIANNERDVTDPKELKKLIPVSGPDKVGRKEYIADRYRSVRIGHNIYVDMGKCDLLKRRKKNPRKATLSFNGLRFEHRSNGEPFSMLWKTKDVQDMTDIMYFHRDNLVANAGVNGSRIDVSTLPDFIGDTMMERLLKVIALKKQGVEPYNGAQNEGKRNQNNVAGDFRGGVDGSMLDAIRNIISQLDEEASKQTGITPQMMGLIEQRDAVTNVKAGISQASLVLKNVYDQSDRVTRHMISDLIEYTQISLSEQDEAFVGTFLEDMRYQTFKLVPKHFSHSDYNIHIKSSSNEFQKLGSAKEAAMALASAGSIDAPLLIRIIKSDSLNELVRLVDKSTQGAQSAAGMMEQLKAQLEELSKENEGLKKKIDQFNQEELGIKQRKIDVDKELGMARVGAERERNEMTRAHNDKIVELKKENTRLEQDQLYLDAKNNAREVKNDI
jgi:hypothetical protein